MDDFRARVKVDASAGSLQASAEHLLVEVIEVLGEAAGHLAGGIARTLQAAGLPEPEAEQWEREILAGAFLVGAHVAPEQVDAARGVLERSRGRQVTVGAWPD